MKRLAFRPRAVALTEEQLAIVNHMRERAGEAPATKEQVEHVLARLPLDEYKIAMERLR